jgi:hypothetical protein
MRLPIAAVLLACIAAHEAAHAQGSIVLVDSAGKTAARPLSDTVVLVSLAGGVAAPASIRPVYDADGRTASGLATWHSGGSVLFTSPDCTSGGHVYSVPHAGVRGAAQVQTANGIVLHAGAIGATVTVSVHSILYDTGCVPVDVRQNGLVPVVATVNLTASYPPPLSYQ